jgi:hypothetical protein
MIERFYPRIKESTKSLKDENNNLKNGCDQSEQYQETIEKTLNLAEPILKYYFSNFGDKYLEYVFQELGYYQKSLKYKTPIS